MKRPVTRGRLLVVCAVLAGLLLGLALTLWALQSNRTVQASALTDAKICRAVNKLDGVIVALLERSQKTLPVNPFYKEHPELLAGALKENARALREFRGAAC